MIALPADFRIPTTADLTSCDAPVGTKLWVESASAFYEAIPYGNAEAADIGGEAELSRVAWRRTRKLGELIAGTTVLSTNASTPVGAVSLASDNNLARGLAASSRYHATLKMRVVIWETADPHNIGSMDYTSDVLITTNSSKVATVALVGTAASDVTRLPAGHSGATCSFAASTGGFTLSATRATDLASTCTAEWEVVGRITKQG
jgi:hypothetical protein